MAVNSLASSTNTVEKSSMTAKGTILIGNGTEPTALTVGANGKALFADSTNSQGVSWSDVPVSYVVDEAFIGSAGTQSVTVNIPAGTYLAKLSPNTSISVGGQTAGQSSVMTFANAQTSVSVTGTTPLPTSWSTVSQGFGNATIKDVAYGNGLWIAAGYTRLLITSTNTTSWVTTTSNFEPTDSLTVVAYGNGRWVVGGHESNLGQVRARTSTNGVLWTTIQLQLSSSTAPRCLAYGNGVWVAGGQQGDISRSTDGVTWGAVTSNFSTNPVLSVAYGNSLWIAAGGSGQIRTSSDGSTWTTRTSNFGTTNISSVAYGNGIWVAVGFVGQIRRSTDGITWTTVVSNSSNGLLRVAYGNRSWIAGGALGTMVVSTDSTTWSTITSNFGNTQISSIANSGQNWVAVGYTGQIRSSTTTPITFHSIFYKNPTIAS